jgi:hypothetical protein
MDTPRSDREIIKQVIRHYAQFKPSHGDIRLDNDIRRGSRPLCAWILTAIAA